MFNALTDKLTKALRDLRGLSKLTAENIGPALNEVNAALLSADVNFKVAQEFTERVKLACLGKEVVESVVTCIPKEIVEVLHIDEKENSLKPPVFSSNQGTNSSIGKYLRRKYVIFPYMLTYF